MDNESYKRLNDPYPFEFEKIRSFELEKEYNNEFKTSFDERIIDNYLPNELLNEINPISNRIFPDFTPLGEASLDTESQGPVSPFSTPEQTFAPSAHRFRTRRLQEGALGSFVRGIREDGTGHSTIKSFTSLRHILNGQEKGAQVPEHRALSPFLTGIMNHDKFRTSFMAALDQTATAESDALKEQARDGIQVDVLIVGAGAQGSVAAARLRADNPELSIISVDESAQLGGQFRSYGSRPTFRINSRAHRADNNSGEAALPGGEKNLNPFSEVSVMQLPDVTTETYPTNTDMGDTIAVNQFFSGPVMLGVKFSSSQRANGFETAELNDVDTNAKYYVKARKIIVLTGSGGREKSSNSENVWSVEQLLSYFGNDANKFPMDAFIGKSVAVIGGGDSGRIAVELLTRLGPKDAYANSVAQLGGPESIAWYGVNFESREEFCATNRSRYEQIRAFIANPDEPDTAARPYYLKKQK